MPDLVELEIKWDAEGKSPSRKRYLRYYYRNRHSLLKKMRIPKNNTGEERVEHVEIRALA